MRMLRTVRLAGAVLTAAVLLPASPAAGAAHVVAPGETLSGIAAANRLSLAGLAGANGLSAQAHVIAGTTLTIPVAAAAAPAAAPAATPAGAGAVGGRGPRRRTGDKL